MATELSVSDVGQKIYLIRGLRVMLDSDLAILYQVETGALKRAVRRNIERFPADFMFELEEKELKDIRSQTYSSETAPLENRGGARYFPFVFTEQGVSMLSAVLTGKRAIEVSIHIVRSFVMFRLASERTSKVIETVFEEKFGELATEVRNILLENSNLPSSAKKSIDRITDEIFVGRKSTNIQVESIQNAVANYYNIDISDLKLIKRTKATVLPRQIAIYLIRKITGIGLKEIGTAFGGKDHTTVLHVCCKIEGLLRSDQNLRKDFRVYKRIALDKYTQIT